MYEALRLQSSPLSRGSSPRPPVIAAAATALTRGHGLSLSSRAALGGPSPVQTLPLHQSNGLFLSYLPCEGGGIKYECLAYGRH